MNVLKKIIRNLNKVKGRVKRKFEMSDKEYYEKMSRAREISKTRRRKQKLKEVRNEGKRKFKPPTTTKVLLFIVVGLCIEMIIFGQVMSWRTGDAMSISSYLTIGGTLITVGCTYMFKSLKENCSKYGDGSATHEDINQTSSSYSSTPTTISEICHNNTTSSESFNVSGGVG